MGWKVLLRVYLGREAAWWWWEAAGVFVTTTAPGQHFDGAFLHFSTFARSEGCCAQKNSPLNFPTSRPEAFQCAVEKFPSRLCPGWEASRGGHRGRAPLQGWTWLAPPVPGSPAGPERGLGHAPFLPVLPPSTAASPPSRCCSGRDVALPGRCLRRRSMATPRC